MESIFVMRKYLKCVFFLCENKDDDDDLNVQEYIGFSLTYKTSYQFSR